jgi:hypothetical protein
MARQLVLISPSEVDWRLDEQTKQVGRRGVGAARAALQQATPQRSDKPAAAR